VSLGNRCCQQGVNVGSVPLHVCRSRGELSFDPKKLRLLLVKSRVHSWRLVWFTEHKHNNANDDEKHHDEWEQQG
jgi:hypothetical protein